MRQPGGVLFDEVNPEKSGWHFLWNTAGFQITLGKYFCSHIGEKVVNDSKLFRIRGLSSRIHPNTGVSKQKRQQRPCRTAIRWVYGKLVFCCLFVILHLF